MTSLIQIWIALLVGSIFTLAPRPSWACKIFTVEPEPEAYIICFGVLLAFLSWMSWRFWPASNDARRLRKRAVVLALWPILSTPLLLATLEINTLFAQDDLGLGLVALIAAALALFQKFDAQADEDTNNEPFDLHRLASPMLYAALVTAGLLLTTSALRTQTIYCQPDNSLPADVSF